MIKCMDHQHTYSTSGAAQHSHSIGDDQCMEVGSYSGNGCYEAVPIPIARKKYLRNVNVRRERLKMKRREVRILVIDDSEYIPDGQCKIYDSGYIFTSLSDDALKIEHGKSIHNRLNDHNEVRKARLDKEMTKRFGRDIYLDPLTLDDVYINIQERR